MNKELLGTLLASFLCMPAAAQSTTTYEYDALGRLTKVSRPAGSMTTYAYDAADNRTSVVTSSGNQPPVAVDDIVYAMLDNEGDTYFYGQIDAYGGNYFANDYDPNTGDSLFLNSVSGNAYASITNGYIRYAGPIGSGHQVIYYTIRDQHGAVSAAAKIDLYFFAS